MSLTLYDIVTAHCLRSAVGSADTDNLQQLLHISIVDNNIERVVLTVIGEQVTPTSMSRPPRTMPRRPRSVEMTGSEDDSTLLQHCREPVEHDSAAALGVGVATARVTSEATNASFLNCMMDDLVCEL